MAKVIGIVKNQTPEVKKQKSKKKDGSKIFVKKHDLSNDDSITVTKLERSQGLLPPKWVHPVDRTVFQKTDEEKGLLLTLKKQWKDEHKCSLKRYKFKSEAKMIL